MSGANRVVALAFSILIGIGLLPTASAQVQAIFDETSEISAAGLAPPVEYTFTTTTAQALTVTLTDLQQPAPFGYLAVAVTLNDAVVGQAVLQTGSTTATVNLPASAGTYRLHVIGTPTGDLGLGFFGICVAPPSTSACIAGGSFSGSIQTPAATSASGTSTLTTNFTAAAAGNYTVTLIDDGFPQALTLLSAGIVNVGLNFVVTNIPGGPAPNGASTQVTLPAAGTYQLLVAAQASSSSPAGLYGIQITDPNGTVVFGRTLPVGTLGASTIVANSSSQTLQLTLADLGYPIPLAALGAAVTEGATPLAALTSAGVSQSFTTATANLEVWQYAVAGVSTSGTTAGSQEPGVYNLSLAHPGSSAAVYSTTQVVEPSAASSSSTFAYVVNLPSAGTYTVAVNDFMVQPLTLSYRVAQNSQPLTVSAGTFTAAAGNAVIVVNAQAGQSGTGLFAVTVGQSSATPSLLLDQTQAVGGDFLTRTINVPAAGSYNLSIADLKFPAPFQALFAAISSGGQAVATIYGGATYTFDAASAGSYLLTFAATPAAATASAPSYGLYSVNVSPAPPTVTFKASATTVTAGQPVQLTWSSSPGTTSCVASGATGWSGSENPSGTVSVTISATVTLSLTCTGPGGSSAPSTVSVTATAAPAGSSGGGGGGSIDVLLIVGLFGVFGANWLRARRYA